PPRNQPGPPPVTTGRELRPPAAPAPAPTAGPTTTTTTTRPPPQAVAVPNVVGSDPDQACRQVQAAGFVCRARASGTDGAPRRVDTQDPKAGAKALPGTTVTADYTEAGVAVPTLLNVSKDEACRRLSSAGLACNPVAVASPQPVPPGAV